MSRNFDGVDDIINFASPAALDNAEPFTVLAWVNGDTFGEGGEARIACKEQVSGSTGRWLCGMVTPRNVNFLKDYATTDLYVEGTGAMQSATAQWIHVAVSWDGNATATTAVKLYLDGSEVFYIGQTDGAGAKRTDAASNLNVGNRGGADKTFDGQMAYVQLYEVVLTQGQIQQQMRAPGSMTHGLLLSAPLFGFRSPTPDYTGAQNPGTVTGAVLGATSPPVNGFGPVPHCLSSGG